MYTSDKDIELSYKQETFSSEFEEIITKTCFNSRQILR